MTKPIRRRSYLKRGSKAIRKPIPRKNKKRADANYARAYHSKVRVEFIKALQCAACWRTPSDNAHIHGSKSGMGRKGPYTDIIPLCRTCHTLYDTHKLLPSEAVVRLCADMVEEAWLNRTEAR